MRHTATGIGGRARLAPVIALLAIGVSGTHAQSAPAVPAARIATATKQPTKPVTTAWRDAEEDIGGDYDPKRPWDHSPLVDRILWAREGRVGADGKFPPEARLRAFREMQGHERQLQLLQTARKAPAAPAAAIPGSVWAAIGPRPAQKNGTTFAGRITAIAAHPADGNIAYVGGAAGGLWKTTNGGLNWVPLLDRQPSLAVGTILLAPGNPDTIFVGTGEPNFGCDNQFGVGILKSTDGGYSWSQLGAAAFANKSISKIIIDPNQPLTMWASTTQAEAGFICNVPGGGNGVYKSTDGGVTWPTIGLPGKSVDDLVMDPFNPLVLYASAYGVGIYKSSDGGVTWGLRLGGGLPTVSLGRIELAVHPTIPNKLYAIFTDATGFLINLYKSVDGGATWPALPTQPSSGNPIAMCRGQCWYDLYLETSSDGTLWVGGDENFRTTDDGVTWPAAALLHSDQHAIAFGPTGTVWVGNDGGLASSVDLGATWTQRNTNLALAQFYPGASLHPTVGVIALAGVQDNNSFAYTSTPIWNVVYAGDGAASAFDFTNPGNIWYNSQQFLVIGKTLNHSTYVDVNNGLTDSNNRTNAPFIAQFAMCPKNAQVLVAGSVTVWRTNDGATNWAANSAAPLLAGGSIRSVAFDPSDVSCATYYVGLQNGKIFRTTVGGGAAAGNWVDISTGLPGRGVSDFAVDAGNTNIVYAAITGFGAGTQVYKTLNALAATPSWSAASSGLPNSPVNAVLVDPGASTVIYAGTDVGVYRSLDSGANWSPFTNGHPAVPVYDLQGNATTGVLISFTHGRSAFQLTLPAARPVPDGKFIPGLPLRVYKAGGANLKLNFDNNSCTPGGTNAYWGNLTPAELSAYTYSGQECGIVSGGNLTTIPAASSAFFVVVGSDGGVTESGNTQDSAGVWRGNGAGRCAITTQTTASSCP